MQQATHFLEEWQGKLDGVFEEVARRAEFGKERAKANLLDFSKDVRKKVFVNIREIVKVNATWDPDMPQRVTNYINDLVETLFDEIEEEIDHNVEVSFLNRKGSQDEEIKSGGYRVCQAYLWVRAFFLYHFLPYDKSFFGKGKDPVFIVFFVFLCVPVHGLRVSFFLLIYVFLMWPSPPNDFQLINFILQFKGTQFVSTGFNSLIKGAIIYFRCYALQGDIGSCINASGPGASQHLVPLMIDYFGGILLAWIAFFSLGRSTRFYTKASFMAHKKSAQEEALSKDGGGLRGLMRFDMMCFFLSLALLALLAILFCDSNEGIGMISDPIFKEAFFWSTVFYSVPSLPFLFLNIPVLLQLITHTDFTGFNHNGVLLFFELPDPKLVKPPAGSDAEQPKSRGFWGFGSSKPTSPRPSPRDIGPIHSWSELDDQMRKLVKAAEARAAEEKADAATYPDRETSEGSVAQMNSGFSQPLLGHDGARSSPVMV